MAPDASSRAAVRTGCPARFLSFFAGWSDVGSVLRSGLTFESLIHCSWTEIKLCHKYPEGHPLRPECCDGYGPKDPIEEPGSE